MTTCIKMFSLLFFKNNQPSPETIDRIIATIYGQCIGDAIGLLTEFLSKREAKLVNIFVWLFIYFNIKSRRRL